jgi:hypothetical protein
MGPNNNNIRMYKKLKTLHDAQRRAGTSLIVYRHERLKSNIEQMGFEMSLETLNSTAG